MVKKSKNLCVVFEKIDSIKVYSVEEVVVFVKEINFVKFDVIVEVFYNFNIDVKKVD